jgi:hypothetical protein
MAVTLKAIAAGNTNVAAKWEELPGTSAPNKNATVSATGSSKTILLTGDRHLEFTVGVTFWLKDNVNDLDCTVVSSSFVSPNTVIIVSTVIADGTAGNALLHRVPVATDNADLNACAMVQVGALTLASLVDVATGGSLDLTGAFTCPLVTDAALTCSSASVVITTGTAPNGILNSTAGNGLDLAAGADVILTGDVINSGAGKGIYFSAGRITAWIGNSINSDAGYGVYFNADGRIVTWTGNSTNSGAGYGVYFNAGGLIEVWNLTGPTTGNSNDATTGLGTITNVVLSSPTASMVWGATDLAPLSISNLDDLFQVFRIGG